MKKLLIILTTAFAFIACGNPSENTKEPGKGVTVPGDTTKIDTVKTQDTIIRG